MQRYSHAAYPNQHRLEENPTGEWVRWEDVEAELRAMQQEITDLKDELQIAEESADRYREESNHADMLRD
jgi:HPt (histidine-containing phosphotransfer) domain-containing protein